VTRKNFDHALLDEPRALIRHIPDCPPV